MYIEVVQKKNIENIIQKYCSQNNKDRENRMKINITAIGKFEYLNNGDEKIDLEIDLLELHSSDFTLDQVITEKFKGLENA